jgi:glycosyltransferase involved in cell wall biosynthesis
MKIIQLVDSLELGGTERMCVNIANGLSSRGIENAVVVTRRPYTLTSRLNRNTSLLTCHKKSRWDIATFIRVFRFIRNENPQFIHAHSTTLLWACIIKMLRPNIKLIWHDHYGNRKQAKDNLIHTLLSPFITTIIGVNDDIIQWHTQNMYVKKDSIVCLPNFATLNQFDFSSRNAHTIVMNANLLPVKDHFTLLKALAILHKQEIPFKVLLIGKEVDPGYVLELKTMINKLDLVDKVVLLGQVNEIEPVLAEASIGVLSSTSEGLPLSILEYGLAGLAVVSTDVGQCGFVLGNGEYGWLVQPKQPDQLASQLITVLNKPLLAAAKSKKFKEHIEMHYSEQAFINKYILHINKQI